MTCMSKCNTNVRSNEEIHRLEKLGCQFDIANSYEQVPNGLGMLLGGGQLILYGIYSKSTPRMQHIAPQEKLTAITVSNQPKDLTSEVIREGTKEGVQDGFAKESEGGAQGQEQTQRKITGPEDV